MGFLDDYEPVEARIAAFYSDHPEGRITTKLIEAKDGHYIVGAAVFRELDEDGLPGATGHAEESVTQKGVNSTSALENCETSAIGRALANLGYAAKGKRPSREEMSKTSGMGVESAHPSPVPDSTSVAGGSTGALDATGNGDEGRVAGPETGEGSDNPATLPDPTHVHVHTWKAAPRAGWMLCDCGKAEMESKLVKAVDAR